LLKNIAANRGSPCDLPEHRLAAGFLKKFAGSRPSIKFDIRKALRPSALANGIQSLHAKDHTLGAAVGCPDVSGLGLDLGKAARNSS
jgi:hypothetical protein